MGGGYACFQLWMGLLRVGGRMGRRRINAKIVTTEAGRTWLRSFMALIDDCQPDFLGAHYYGTVAAEAETYLSSLHDEFGLPVIVSEIASISRDAPAVEAFTRDVANWMDEADWVVEYGFFGCMKNVADDVRPPSLAPFFFPPPSSVLPSTLPLSSPSFSHPPSYVSSLPPFLSLPLCLPLLRSHSVQSLD